MNIRRVAVLFTCLFLGVFLLTFEIEPTNKKDDPIIFIFGLGGSGTRGVTQLYHSWGCKNVSKVSSVLDHLFYTKQVNMYIYEILEQTRSANYEYASLNKSLLKLIDDKMQEAMYRIRYAQQFHPCAVIKAPRLAYMLPVLRHYFPRCKLIHVVRDARDMAFSRNIRQLLQLGHYIMDDTFFQYFSLETQQDLLLS